MINHVKKTSVRSFRTRAALLKALCTLLERRSFTKVTVCDICHESMVSRSTFYSHFKDKYDLLDLWLTYLKRDYLSGMYEDRQKFMSVSQAAHGHVKILTNLLQDSDRELFHLLADFLSPELDSPAEEHASSQINTQYSMLSKFCAGGLLNMLLTAIDDQDMLEDNMTITYVYDILRSVQEWNRVRKR